MGDHPHLRVWVIRGRDDLSASNTGLGALITRSNKMKWEPGLETYGIVIAADGELGALIGEFYAQEMAMSVKTSQVCVE